MNGFLQTHADRLASGCSGVSGGTKQKKIVRKGGGTDLLAGPREKYGGGEGMETQRKKEAKTCLKGWKWDWNGRKWIKRLEAK